MQVVGTSAQPTLQFDVSTPDEGQRRVTVFTGSVDVVPPDHGRPFRVVRSDPNGVPVSFYVGDHRPLPIAGAVLVAEAWVARMPISTGAENTMRYGIIHPRGGLAPLEGDADLGQPYVQGLLFGGDLTMTLAYRLTVTTLMSPR